VALSRLLSLDQVARYVGKSPATVKRWVKLGKFPPPTFTGQHPKWREDVVNGWRP